MSPRSPILLHCSFGIPVGDPHSLDSATPPHNPVRYVVVVVEVSVAVVVVVVVVVVVLVTVVPVTVVIVNVVVEVVVRVAVVVVSTQSVAPSPFPSPPRVSCPDGQSMHGVPEKSSSSYWPAGHFRHVVAASFVWYPDHAHCTHALAEDLSSSYLPV